MKRPVVTRKRILILLPAALLLSWLLWPLGDRRFAIEADIKKIHYKEQFLASLRARSQRKGKRPNIVVILADDLGKTDISLYGGRHLQTPHIDSIGTGGVTFTEAYCSAPVCSPSRASLLTGRYQQRYGFYRQPMSRYPRNRLEMLVAKYMIFTGDWRPDYMNATPRAEDIRRQGIPESEITLGDLLKGTGYRTAITGKWHLGHEKFFLPNSRGFEEQYGFYEAFSLYSPVDDPDIINHRHDYFASQHIWGQGREGTCAVRRNDTVIDEKKYLTFRIAEEANSFIQKNRKQPFFLYVPFNAPHTPFQAPKKYVQRFSHIKDKNKRIYYAMIAALDDAVGSILQTIKDENIEEDTLVFFASDNGGATYTGATENAPLKGGKFSNFEGGINIPLMMRQPGVVPGGKKNHEPTILMDVFATAVGAAGAILPGDRNFDGVDLLASTVSGKKKAPRALYWKSGYNRAIRKGKYKLILNDRSGSILLYDLKKDKVEAHNLKGNRPEIVNELLKDLEYWEKKMVPPLWPGFMNYRFKIDGESYMFSI